MQGFFFFYCDPLFRNEEKIHLTPPEYITSYCFHFLTPGTLLLETITLIFLAASAFCQCPFFLFPLQTCHFRPLPSSSSFSILQLTNLTEIHDQISGMARCPYNPLHNSTALITSSGELYAATAMDFSGRDPAIYRSLGGLPPLRTAQYNSKWLNGKEAAP